VINTPSLSPSQGLDYLHKSGIVHGDLKPANILLRSARNDRRGFVCKVGDFGLSRALGAEQTHLETANFGTASYAAPELLSGKLSSASDIYSFGMIIWGLASGSEPYPDWNAMQIIVQVSQQGHRPDVPADCPPFLAALLQRCWSQDPLQRPSAAAIVKELRGELQQHLRPQAAAKPAD
jgi:serine/threonine protein kinase